MADLSIEFEECDIDIEDHKPTIIEDVCLPPAEEQLEQTSAVYVTVKDEPVEEQPDWAAADPLAITNVSVCQDEPSTISCKRCQISFSHQWELDLHEQRLHQNPRHLKRKCTVTTNSRGPGRPSKNSKQTDSSVSVTEIPETNSRRPGRLSKSSKQTASSVSVTEISDTNSRGPGRPSKNSKQTASSVPITEIPETNSRGPGRLRKSSKQTASSVTVVPTEISDTNSRRPGRPSKNSKPTASSVTKVPTEIPEINSRRPGRPSKNSKPTASSVSVVPTEIPETNSRRPGRPSKNSKQTASSVTKVPTEIPETNSQRPGRPKKNSKQTASSVSVVPIKKLQSQKCTQKSPDKLSLPVPTKTIRTGKHAASVDECLQSRPGITRIPLLVLERLSLADIAKAQTPNISSSKEKQPETQSKRIPALILPRIYEVGATTEKQTASISTEPANQQLQTDRGPMLSVPKLKVPRGPYKKRIAKLACAAVKKKPIQPGLKRSHPVLILPKPSTLDSTRTQTDNTLNTTTDEELPHTRPKRSLTLLNSSSSQIETTSETANIQSIDSTVVNTNILSEGPIIETTNISSHGPIVIVTSTETTIILTEGSIVSSTETANISSERPMEYSTEDANIPSEEPIVSTIEITNISTEAPIVSSMETENIPSEGPIISTTANIPSDGQTEPTMETADIPSDDESTTGADNFPSEGPNEEAESSDSGEGIQVEKASWTAEGKRKFDKKTVCMFCKKRVTNFARHLGNNHPSRPEVVKILSLKSGKEKFDLLQLLRNKGAFLHNAKVLSTGKGTLMLCHRVSSDKILTSAEARNKYKPCPYCYGYYRVTSLRDHAESCNLKFGGVDLNHSRIRDKILKPFDKDASERLTEHILSTVKSDSLRDIISQDQLVSQYGIYLLDSIGQDKGQHGYIKSTLCEVARFLLAMWKVSDKKCKNLEQVLDASKWDLTLQAISLVSEKYLAKKGCDKPELAININKHLLKLCILLETSYLVDGDEAMVEKLAEVKKLFQTSFRNSCAQKASESVVEKQAEDAGETVEDHVQLEMEVNEEDEWGFEDEIVSKPVTSQQQEPTNMEEEPAEGTSTNVVAVEVASRHANGKRVFDKKTFCLFCKCHVTNFTRHLKVNHDSEPEVEKMMTLKPGKEKSKLLDALRKRGSFIHNAEVLATGKGKLKLGKRVSQSELPSGKALKDSFTPCLHCHGYYSIKNLAMHMKKCIHKVKDVSMQTIRMRSKMLKPVDCSSEQLRDQILDTMREDAQREIICKDPIILQYATYLADSMGADIHRHRDIRVYLREVARFILAVRHVSHGKCLNLEQILDSANWKLILDAINHVMNNTKLVCNKLQLANKVRQHLVKICTVLEAQYLLGCDNTKLEKLAGILKLLDTDQETFAKQVHATFSQEVEAATAAMYSQLRQSVSDATKKLLENPSEETYTKLASVMQGQILMFNGKRVYEVTNISKAIYEGRETAGLNEATAKVFDITSPMLAKQLQTVEVYDQVGRRVSILFTRRMANNLDVLLEHREAAGVKSTNRFLFAKPNSDDPFRAGDSVKLIVLQSNVEFPSTLESATLRRQVASLVQRLEAEQLEREEIEARQIEVADVSNLEPEEGGRGNETDPLGYEDGGERGNDMSPCGSDDDERGNDMSPCGSDDDERGNDASPCSSDEERGNDVSPVAPEKRGNDMGLLGNEETEERGNDTSPVTREKSGNDMGRVTHEKRGNNTSLAAQETEIGNETESEGYSDSDEWQNDGDESSESSSESEDTDQEQPPTRLKRSCAMSKLRKAKSLVRSKTKTISSLDKVKKRAPTSPPEPEGLRLDVTSNYADGRRKFDKKTFCMFCHRLTTNFARHLVHRHKSEPEVQELAALETGKERDELIGKLRKRGAFVNNAKVLSRGKGKLLIQQRVGSHTLTAEEDPLLNFTPCLFCHAYYKIKSLANHMRNCTQKVEGVSLKHARAKSKLLRHVATDANERLTEQIISNMREDPVREAISQDSSILLYSSFLLDNLGADRRQDIRSAIRLVGRYALAVQKASEGKCTTLEQVLNVANWDTMLQAVICVTEDEYCNTAQVVPGRNAAATSIGIHLVKICTLLEAQCLVKNQREMLQKLVEVKKMLETRYKTAITQKLAEKEQQNSGDPNGEPNTDNDGIQVEVASTLPNGKRKFDKKTFCLFCEKLVTNFARHLSKNHPSEPEVEKLVTLPSGKEKCELLNVLRNRGAFKNNNRVLSSGKGMLMVKQRKTKYQTLSGEEAKQSFSPCIYCQGYYSVKNLAQHVAQCSHNTQGGKVPRGVRAKCKLLKLSAEGASEQLKEAILSKMKDDRITDIIFQDPSILRYGNFMLDNVGSQVHLYKNVKAGLREVARFMSEVLEVSEGKCEKLEQVLDESEWDTLIEAVKGVCGDEEGSGKQQLPGRIRKHLMHICSILKSQQPENAEKLVRVKDLLNTTYKTILMQPAAEVTEQTQKEKEIELPSEVDLQTLHSYLKKGITEALGNLIQNPCNKTYSKLAGLLQVQLFLFSGRKVSEVTTISKEKYETRVQLSLDASLAQSRNIPSHSLAKELYRTEVLDHLGKKVPVLFSTQMVRCLNVLIDHRETVGVESSNEFLFARPNSEYPIRAGISVKQIVAECSVKFPGCLASDKVRSHIARLFQCFELGTECPVTPALGKKQAVQLETDDFNDSDGWEFAGDDLFDRSAANSPEVDQDEQLQSSETVSKKNYIREAVFSLPGPSQPDCSSEVPSSAAGNEVTPTEPIGDLEALSQFEPGILNSATKIVEELEQELLGTDNQDHTITTLENAVVHEADGEEMEMQPPAGTSSEQVASTAPENHTTIVSTATSYEDLKVSVTLKNKNGKMKNDKRTHCIFCKKYVTNFSRHLNHRHKSEPEVQKILAMETGLEKDRRIDALRKRGAFLHNAQVLSTGKGTLMLKCRSGRKQITSGEQVKLNFSPCLYCQAYYSVTNLTTHMRKCSQRGEGEVVNHKYARSRSKIMKPIAVGASEELKQHILAKMRDDIVGDVVCQDSCILRYGTYLVDFNKDEILHRDQYIRNMLRSLAKFVLVIRKLSNGECANIESILDESKWDLLLEAVSCMVQESDSVDKKKEHLAHSVAQALEKICTLLEDGETTEKFAGFKKLLHDDFKAAIIAKANINKKRPKRKKEKQEPVASDVTNVFLYLKKNISEVTENLVHDPCAKTYAKLITLLQSQLVFFNGRKFAEIGRIYKENFESRDQGGLSMSAAKSLNIPSQMLASQLDRIDVLDVCEEKVPVLFTRQMVHSVKVLVNHREAVGVKSSNPYLFARPNSDQTYRAGDSVKLVVSECNTQFPDALRATPLRKQVASMFQRLEFSDNQPARQEEDSTTTDIVNLLTNLELGHGVREKRTPLVAEIDELMDGWDFDGNGVAERPPVYAQRANIAQPNKMRHINWNFLQQLELHTSGATGTKDNSRPGPSRPDTSKPRSARAPANELEDSSEFEEEEDEEYLPAKKAKKGKSGKNEKNKEPSGRTWTKWSEEEMFAARTACASSIQQEVQPRKAECEEAFKRFPILAARCNNCWKKLKDWVKSDIEKIRREKKLSSK